MKASARRWTEQDEPEEFQKLRDILDKSYTQMREQARLEYRRRCTEPDPSDACVQVRIHCDQQRRLAN